MIANSIKIGGAAAGLLLLSLGVVRAQSAEATPVAGDAASTATPPATPKTPQQILEEGRATLDRMEATADNVSRMLREARKKKDVVKTLCLDDVLSQLNVAARSATDRVASIEAAAATNNKERAEHDDAVLGALSKRATELSAEANQCVGEETGVLGESTLEITVDDDIPKEDTGAPRAPVMISTPPVAASPTI